jgi:hypothetical protein
MKMNVRLDLFNRLKRRSSTYVLDVIGIYLQGLDTSLLYPSIVLTFDGIGTRDAGKIAPIGHQ